MMDTEQYLTKSTLSSNLTPSDFYTQLKSKDNNEPHSSLLESTSVSTSDLGPMYNIIPVEGFETTCLDSISEPDMNHSTVTSDIDSPTVYYMDSIDRMKSGNDGSVEMQLIVEDDSQSDNGIKNVISNNCKDNTTHKNTTPTCSIIIEGNKPYKMKSSTRAVASDPVSGSWVTLRHQKEDLKNKGHTWKKGSWSREEIYLLQQNISIYCQDRNISDPTEIIFQNCKVRRSRGDFYPTIAAGLNRSLFSVYRRVRRMYDVKNYKGRYSEEELEKLKELVQVHGRDWTVIAQHLGRSSDSVKDRCRLMKAVNSTPLSRGKWTPSEEELLIDAVRDATKTERGVSVTEGIPWSLVAKMVKTRTEKQCRAKWLNYLNWKTLNGPKWSKEDDIKLVERVYNLNVSSENDIVWADLTKDWPSARSPQWLHFKWSNLRKVVQQYWDECPFVETVEILRKLYHVNLVKLYDQPKQFFKILLEKFRGVLNEKQLKPSERFTIAADQFLSTLESNHQTVQQMDGDDKSPTTSFTVLSADQLTARNISPLLINSNQQLLLRHQTTTQDESQLNNFNSLMVRSKAEASVSSSKIDSSPSSCDIAWIPNDQISLPQGTYSIASSLGEGLYVIEASDEIITFGENGIYLPSDVLTVFHSQGNESVIATHSTSSSSSRDANSNDITLNSANTVFLPHSSGRGDDDDDDGGEVFASTQLQTVVDVDHEGSSPMLQISI